MKLLAIKTAESEAAVSRIKNMTRKHFYPAVPSKLPKEFVEKREYMQSDEFLKDEHNIKMLELGEDLFVLRTKIGKEIENLNQKLGDKFVQAINGFARIKKDIEKDFYLNFEEVNMGYVQSEKQYETIKNVEMHAEAQKVK